MKFVYRDRRWSDGWTQFICEFRSIYLFTVVDGHVDSSMYVLKISHNKICVVSLWSFDVRALNWKSTFIFYVALTPIFTCTCGIFLCVSDSISIPFLIYNSRFFHFACITHRAQDALANRVVMHLRFSNHKSFQLESVFNRMFFSLIHTYIVCGCLRRLKWISSPVPMHTCTQTTSTISYHPSTNISVGASHRCCCGTNIASSLFATKRFLDSSIKRIFASCENHVRNCRSAKIKNYFLFSSFRHWKWPNVLFYVWFI